MAITFLQLHFAKCFSTVRNIELTIFINQFKQIPWSIYTPCMINHRNDVKMCKTQMEPLATGKWLKIVFCFFTITLMALRSFPEKFLGKSGP